MSFALYPHQQEIKSIVCDAIEQKDKIPRIIVQLPTGMGKTVVFSSIIRSLGRKTLVLAHMRELLDQAKTKLIRAGFDDGEIDIVQCSRPNPDAKIWVASVQTLVRGERIAQINPELIVIDECHHSAAQSYRTVLDKFPGVPAIGFSATPTRSATKEKKILKEIWDKIVYQFPIKRAILEGWLARIEYYQIKTTTDISGVGTLGGDFKIGALSKEVNTPYRNSLCVEEFKKRGGGKCIVYCVNVEHCYCMANAFAGAGIKSAVVVGETAAIDRKRIFAEFQESPMNSDFVLVCCMVATEGYDCPDVRMIIQARPTQSVIVYLQILGRGLRVAPGKESCIVIDLADNCKKKKICNCLTTVFNLRPGVEIEGDIVGKMALVPGPEKESEPQEETPIEVVLSNFLFDMPIELERSRLAWFSPAEKQYFCYVDKGKYFRIDESDLESVLYGCNGNGERKVLATNIDLAEIDKYAASIVDQYWPNNAFMWDKSRRENWSNDAPTERQVKMIARLAPEIDVTKISKATASEIIGACMTKREQEPATRSQKYFLRLNGVEFSETISKRAAARLIGEFRKNICYK